MSNYYIQHSVKISENKVLKNGELVFLVPANEQLGSFLKQIYKANNVGYSKYFKMDKLSKLGFLATELLLNDVSMENKKDTDTAVVFANSASSLHTDHNFQQTIEDIPSPAVFVYTLANIVIGEVCIKHGFKGETAFFVQDSFDVDFMTEYVNIVLSTTSAKQCVLGWVEVDANENYEAVLALISDNKNEIELDTDSVKAIFK